MVAEINVEQGNSIERWYTISFLDAKVVYRLLGNILFVYSK